jgi:uridine phosphorylase
LILTAIFFDISRRLDEQVASTPGHATTRTFIPFIWPAKPLALLGVSSVLHSQVLIAEELFATGCRFVVSLTSAGQIVAAGPLPYFVIIDRALRDEGTSYHYAAPSEFAEADPRLVAIVMDALTREGRRVVVGASWTTDAPFRETAEAIEGACAKGVLAVEMEAAALYTFARARSASVLCLAHVTNTMGRAERDFEKGEADGTAGALKLLETVVRAVRSPQAL